MEELSRRSTLAALGIVMLGGCGGGDGGSSASAPTSPPLPPPPPPPAPPPPPPPPTVGTLGLTEPLTMPAIGFSVRAAGTGWEFAPDVSSYNFGPGTISMRFAPQSNLYLSVAGSAESAVTTLSSSSPNYYQGEVVGLNYTALGGDLWLHRPVMSEKILRYAIRGYLTAKVGSGTFPYLVAEFAYGIATAASALPTSGTRTYRMEFEIFDRLTVDFAARTVTAAIQLRNKDYKDVPAAFRDVLLLPDGSGFSGKVAAIDGSIEGTIEGKFFGPTGEELAIRTAIDPAKTAQISLVAFGLRDT